MINHPHRSEGARVAVTCASLRQKRPGEGGWAGKSRRWFPTVGGGIGPAPTHGDANWVSSNLNPFSLPLCAAHQPFKPDLIAWLEREGKIPVVETAGRSPGSPGETRHVAAARPNSGPVGSVETGLPTHHSEGAWRVWKSGAPKCPSPRASHDAHSLQTALGAARHCPSALSVTLPQVPWPALLPAPRAWTAGGRVVCRPRSPEPTDRWEWI